MEESSLRRAGPATDPAESQRLGDGALLLLVVVAVGLIHAWQIQHTAVAARDSIAFIRVAWQLEHQPTTDVLRRSLHPPLYPLTVLAISLPVRKLLPHVPEPLAMQYSAQVASALAGILLVVPMFYLGRALFDRRVGFWAALLFQCLPVSSRAMSDGLTEGLYLLLIASGLLASVYAFRRGSVAWFGVCGLCTGLAYLTRPEGPLLGLSIGLVLLAARRWEVVRWSWPRTLACGSALTAAALAVGAPYMLTIGGVTNKTSGKNVLHAQRPAQESAPTGSPQGGVSRTPVGMAFAVFHEGWREDFHPGSLAWGLAALCKETGKSFHYVLWLPVIVGLWWFRGRLHGEPGACVPLVMCLLHGVLLTRLATVAGYVSERHTLLFVLCGLYWAVADLLALPEQLRALARMGPRSVAGWQCRWVVEAALLLALVAASLPETLKPLHAGRVGHKEAGFWIAAHADAADLVFDPFCWAHFYAGRVFDEGVAHPVPARAPKTFVVLDHSNHHSRIPQLPEARRLAESGKPVYQWPAGRGALVEVYEVNP